MPLWHRLAVFGAVLVVTATVARLLDARIARRALDPVQKTRYRVLRRSVATAVSVVGVLSRLLGIPPVRSVPGGLLSSSAGIGVCDGVATPRALLEVLAGAILSMSQY